MNPFQLVFDKNKLRKEKIQEAREAFVNFLDILKSPGWKAYSEKVDKKIEIIKNRLADDTSLTGEDLKRLQLALQVWKEVKRIPKDIEEDAKKGV